MNKKNIIACIGLIILIVLVIFFIKKNNINTSISNYHNLKKRSDIYIEVQEKTVTNEILEYTIYNKTNETITYGAEYEIEIYENSEWKQFNIQVDWIEIGYIIEPYSSKTINIRFKEIYGELLNGKYRIIKKINNIITFDEFEIK